MNRLLFYINIFLIAVFTGCSEQGRYVEQINKILNWDNSDGEFTDEQFEKVFKLIENNPKTLKYDFSEVRYLDVVTSDDSKVRAYILERHGFESNPSNGFDSRTLIQYRIADKIYTLRFPETYSSICEIVSFTNNSYMFLTYWGFVAQGEHSHNQVKMYRIDDKGLELIPKVFEVDGRLTDEIEVYWEAGICHQDEEMPEADEDIEVSNKGILYNYPDKTLYVAKTKMTSAPYEVLYGAFNRYTWDGSIFREVTLMEPYEVKNDDYYIRIEQSKDGQCIYRCWNHGVKKGKPDLVIKDGIRQFWSEMGLCDYDKWISLDEYTPLGEKYTFKNNGYTYEYYTGWSRGRLYEDLYVYAPNESLLYSGGFEQVHAE